MNEGLYVPRDQTRHLTVVSGLELKSRNFSENTIPEKRRNRRAHSSQKNSQGCEKLLPCVSCFHGY